MPRFELRPTQAIENLIYCVDVNVLDNSVGLMCSSACHAAGSNNEFEPVRSRCTLDLTDATFRQSDAFSRIMEEAHEFAVSANYCYR